MKIKQNLFQLTLILLLASCANPQKLLEKGDYDRAYKTILSQLESNKSKPSKETIKVLDEALEGIWKKDSTHIFRLSQSTTEKDWDKALESNQELREKLDRSRPYTRSFDKRYDYLVEFDEGFREELFYTYRSRGLEGVEKYELSKRKTVAQSAYHNFRKALEYGNDSEVDSLANVMFNKGIMVYQVDVGTRLVFGIFDSDIDRIFDDIESYSGGFRRIVFERSVNNIDCVMEIILQDLDFEIDESSSTEDFREQVQDGYETQVDTSGQEIQIPKFITVTGSVTTRTIRKTGTFEAEVNIYSKSDDCTLSDSKFRTSIQDAITRESRSGDERALPNDFSNTFEEELRDDDELAEEMVIDLYQQVVNYYFN